MSNPIPQNPGAIGQSHNPMLQGSQPKQNKGQNEQFLSLSRQVSDLLSRLRLLEERYANLRREQQTTSQNMIEHHQSLSKQQRRLNDRCTDVKRSLTDMQEQIGNMQGELGDAAKAHELMVVQRYLDFWEPMNFLTVNDAKKIIREALEKNRQ